MSQMIQLSVPNDLIEIAQKVAHHSRREVEDVLLDWMQYSILLDALPDEDIENLADMQMDSAQDGELRELLAQQRESAISGEGRIRLDELMNVYRRGMVIKAEALRVAVQRGLRPPMHS